MPGTRVMDGYVCVGRRGVGGRQVQCRSLSCASATELIEVRKTFVREIVREI